jgi:hypothetical protein
MIWINAGAAAEPDDCAHRRRGFAMCNKHDIATYLTLDGHVFIAPHYNIAFDRQSGECPDFVALDLKQREVVIVEVTDASNPQHVASLVVSRAIRWYAPVEKVLRDRGIVGGEWTFRFLGFVRSSNVDKLQRQFPASSDPDVKFVALEEAAFPWRYWDDRIANGLPR